MPAIGIAMLSMHTKAATKVKRGQRITLDSAGRYSQISTRLIGLLRSSGMRPRMK